MREGNFIKINKLNFFQSLEVSLLKYKINSKFIFYLILMYSN